jgi:HD superfamily phosphohydrolase YqeK
VDSSEAVARAAAGETPEWACMTAERRAHAGRVAELLDGWAAALALPDEERSLWRAAGWLHDALRDAPPADLRRELGPGYDDWPDGALHGPAAAGLLEGAPAELVEAVRHHTLGSRGLGRLGRALYVADYVEPGRDFAPSRTAALRKRMPGELDAVVREVAAGRIEHLRRAGRRPHRVTEDFSRSLEQG